MSLRRVKVSDLEAIMQIDHEVLQTNWHERLYLEEIANPASIFNCLILEDKLIGFILFREIDDLFEMFQFAIAKTFQNKGFGAILFEHSLMTMKGSSILLEVSSTNTQARSFYEKYGFEPLRVRKNYYGLNDDAIVMRKRLI